MEQHDRIILGIDPGTQFMGYALLAVDAGKPSLMLMGVIRLSPKLDHYMRLRRIYERVQQIVKEYLPDEMAIEAPFCGKNVQSMLKLGRAQGVAMAAALTRDVPIHEYAPMVIKQCITGTGAASKERVAGMLQRLLNIPDDKMPDLLDATDALGVALTHFYETGKPQLPAGPKSWGDFLKANPGRIAPRRGTPVK